MIALTQVTETTVLAAWAVAELRGPAGPRMVEAGFLSAQVLDGLRSGLVDSLSANGWEEAIAAIRIKRELLIGNLFTLGIEWYATAFAVEELRALEIIAVPEWLAKYPTRTMGELAGARSLEGIEPEFRGFGTALESPIAVAATLDGPRCLLEGYTRVGTFLRDVQAGLTPDTEMRMLVGVSPRIHEWHRGPQGWAWWPARG